MAVINVFKKCPLITVALFTVVFVSLVFIQDQAHVEECGGSPQLAHNPLDGCHHLYLDLGTNLGVQIRKLFEPEKYPDAPVIPKFREYFGNHSTRLPTCAIGFEPNARHTQHLEALEQAYQGCGFRTQIFTQTAVGHKTQDGFFYSDGDFEHHEWGGSILESMKVSLTTTAKKVQTIRLLDYLKTFVATRKLPSARTPNPQPPKVVVKMDIEGSELEVLTDLLTGGGLQHVDVILIEWHPESFSSPRKSLLKGLKKAMETLDFIGRKVDVNSPWRVLEFDDETYLSDGIPLPQC